MLSKLLAALTLLEFFYPCLALNNGLALTPPMGWMTWGQFRCNTDCKLDPDRCISENLIKKMIDRLAEDGYAQVGYEYVVIDDCWMAKTRDYHTNRLVADPQRFPSGIRALSDYAHSRGLKLGIYANYGTHTCEGYPGSINHMELDAQTFAEWQVDYVKMDGCYADAAEMHIGYPLMSRYLNQTNRAMVFSCSWPYYESQAKLNPNYTAIAEHCNLWRNYGDIDYSLPTLHNIINWFGSHLDQFSAQHQPGSWNDPDMLMIGHPLALPSQSKTQMAMWSILAAPLMMSNDLRRVSADTKSILQNKNMININQDKLGKMGRRIKVINRVIQVWSKELSNDRTAFVIYNSDPIGADKPWYTLNFWVAVLMLVPARVELRLDQLELSKYSIYDFYETFSGKYLGRFGSKESFVASVYPQGNVYAFWAEPVVEGKSRSGDTMFKQFNTNEAQQIKL